MLLELLVADWPWGPHGLTLATMKEYLWIGSKLWMHTESQKMSLKTHSSLIIGKAIKEKPPREREVHNSPLKIDVFGCFILNLII